MCSDILFYEAHPFTCEINKEERAEWVEVCKKLKAMNASVVIPGHMRMGMPFDNTGFDWTIDYIEKTEIELERAKTRATSSLPWIDTFPTPYSRRATR
jgi:hypothetical protein